MKLATTTGDFGQYCSTYLERIQHVHEAGFRYIDLSMYDVRPGDEIAKDPKITNIGRNSAYVFKGSQPQD